MKLLFGTSILGATLSFLSVASYAQTPIHSVPYTITAPGSYVLSSDLVYSASSGNAITVNASNVTINFNGFNLDCPTANNLTRGVYVNARNHVIVENGEIIGFWRGIDFESPTLGSSNIANLVDAVLFKGDEFTVECIRGTACVVQNCQMVNGSGGVDFEAGTGNRATNNIASGESFGFFSNGTDYFDSNYADHCTYGFYATSGTTKFRFNTTTNCSTGVWGGTSEFANDE
jgi:hypothetical protein